MTPGPETGVFDRRRVGIRSRMWQRLKQWLTGRTKAQDVGKEADVAYDPAQPSDSTSYVGRRAEDDRGYAGETGAERRADQSG